MRTGRGLGVAIVLLGALVTAAPASAGCGGVKEFQPAKRTTKGKPPLAIGDSVMLLALPDLAKRGFVANAHGCRGFQEGLHLLHVRRKHLPKMVVMALGADFSISRQEIRRALHILGPERLLVLVTPIELGGSGGRDAEVVREAGQRYRRHILVLDWVAHSRGHKNWFQPDGTHLTFKGAREFAKLIAQSLPYAGGPDSRRRGAR
jgi:hypothetical protein